MSVLQINKTVEVIKLLIKEAILLPFSLFVLCTKLRRQMATEKHVNII